jgi:hypothetical protein
MDLFTRKDLKALLAEPRTPCVSIYMPTHRGGREEDPIRWRVHLAEAEENLIAAGLRVSDAKELLKPARQLLDDVTFWKHQCDGLAFFLAPQFLCLYRLPIAFEDLVVVADRFHIVPLLPLLSDNGRFYILALSQNAVRLLQGTRYSVSEVDLKGVPRNLAEALLTHDRDEPLRVHSRPVGGIGSWGAIFSGQGVGIDDAKDDLLQYFQRIDRGLHPVLREDRAPLVLASVDYFLPIYRAANTYPHLLGLAVEGNPDRLSTKELHAKAWALVQPLFERAKEQAAAQYRQLAGTGRTAVDLKQVLAAAYHGEIETLFISLGSRRWGRFDLGTGRAEEHDRLELGDEDLLNLVAVYTLLHGRTVYAVDPEQVPGGGPLAAVFCLPLVKRGKRP